MQFKDSILLCLKERFYRISGRASRFEFWSFALFFVITQSLIFAISRFIPIVGDLIFALSFIILLCPLVCVGVRRLHDLNLKGAIILMPLLLAILIVVFGDLALRLQDEKIVEACFYAALGFAFFFLAFLFLMQKPGTAGENQYGADPLQETNQEDTEKDKAQEALKRFEEVKDKIKRQNPFKFTNRKE